MGQPCPRSSSSNRETTATSNTSNGKATIPTSTLNRPKTAFEKIVDYLTSENWRFAQVPEDGKILMSITGNNGSYRVLVDVKVVQDADDKILIVYVFLPVKVPEIKRLAVAEFTTRANYGLIVGNFELDMADGEVRYKNSIEYAQDDALNHAMVERLIHKAAGTMDRYCNGLMRIIYNDAVDAVDAIRTVEPRQAQGEGTAYALAQLINGILVNEDNNDNGAEDVVATTTATEVGDETMELEQQAGRTSDGLIANVSMEEEEEDAS